MQGPKIFALSLAFSFGTPALAQNLSAQSAEQRVERTAVQLAKARASGDAVTIADARARNEAAKATAWGRRHPARQPSVSMASVKR